ncbi:MAG: hypothetical protein PUB89_07950 [Oscillospiraceae bacterium]|nr:hypothetical protein [Oscillospiraceae bacterium]MDD6082760.1 hypothetical protein [Oscillospiraceae bacterium]
MSEKSKNKGCIISAIVIILIPFLFFVGINIIDKIPRTIDIQKNNTYTIELQAIGSPEWSFGPQDGRIVLKKDNKIIEKEKFLLRNDGKKMDEYNWKVSWKNDLVTVTIIGEEQEDETYVFELS